MRIEIAALAVAHGAVGENHQLGTVADPLHRLLDLLDGARRRLGLGRAMSTAAAARPRNSSQRSSISQGLVLAGDPAVGRVGERAPGRGGRRG